MSQNIKLMLGDCLDKLKEIPSNSVDSIVTDPPYELGAPINSGKTSKGGFMGKSWDNTGIAYNVEMWKECLRVLKPGGHLLSFGATRTYHRMAVAIEDAGFEVRDMIEWIYGSGFPKSMNIGKAVDKLQGNKRISVGNYIQPDGKPRNPSVHKPNAEVRNADHVYGYKSSGYGNQTKGTSEWEGTGTALKPAHEPICMARKPLSEKTVVANCLKWRTGGINIDESRVPTSEVITNHSRGAENVVSKGKYGDSSEQETHQTSGQQLGRFPANLILDEEAGKILDEQSGISKSSGGSGEKSMGALGKNGIFGEYALDIRGANIGGVGDTGGASRFFYCPKASKKDRNEGLHEFEIEYELKDNVKDEILLEIKKYL